MLSDVSEQLSQVLKRKVSLNAPYGARCFLTPESRSNDSQERPRLNAPYGARCFLTEDSFTNKALMLADVLMHLMALGAF